MNERQGWRERKREMGWERKRERGRGGMEEGGGGGVGLPQPEKPTKRDKNPEVNDQNQKYAHQAQKGYCHMLLPALTTP